MAARERTEAEIEIDRVKIAKMYLEGYSQRQMAKKLGVSRDIIRYDLDALREEWLQSSLVDFDRKQAIELAKIDKLEATYWRAWHRSLRKRTKKTTEHMPTAVDDSDKDDRGKFHEEVLQGGGIAKLKVQEEERDGNKSFLDGVQWCIDRRCAILGLNAPLKTKIEGDVIKLYGGIDFDVVTGQKKPDEQ